jgi:membrane protein implicated in regulation of membrane protease activity
MFNKPTPTPLPPATAIFTIPDTYSLWAGTDYALQSWNLLTARTIIQAIIFVVLIVVGLYLLSRFVRDFTQRDSQD